jgi:CRISPR-associated protein Csm4
LKVYQVILKPLTCFGTPIKGDTLFGHVCWQIAYDETLVGEPLDNLLKDYDIHPFSIFSSAFPYHDNKIYLKRPSLPLYLLFSLDEEEIIAKRKQLKEKNYFVYTQPLPKLNQIEYEKISFVANGEQARCSIDRVVGKTTQPPFGPFVIANFWYLTDLVIFVGIREDIPVEGILKALERVGEIGFGKDATCGWGKFKLVEYKEIDFYEKNPSFNAYYTLSPSVPEQSYKKIYYEPFVRFGRHGDVFSISSNPFKAPVLMADEGAIYLPDKAEKKVYLGKAIKNVSTVLPNCVTQGYSLVIPVEVQDEI